MSTQQERSRQTRKKLVDATLSCLQDHGYAGASLSRILERAGVSRGAWSHHYENKRAMVADSAETLLATALVEAHGVGEGLFFPHPGCGGIDGRCLESLLPGAVSGRLGGV